MKSIIVILIAGLLAGCGMADRAGALVTGHSKQCIGGVLYYQFASGTSVAYKQNGQVKICDE